MAGQPGLNWNVCYSPKLKPRRSELMEEQNTLSKEGNRGNIPVLLFPPQLHCSLLLCGLLLLLTSVALSRKKKQRNLNRCTWQGFSRNTARSPIYLKSSNLLALPQRHFWNIWQKQYQLLWPKWPFGSVSFFWTKGHRGFASKWVKLLARELLQPC